MEDVTMFKNFTSSLLLLLLFVFSGSAFSKPYDSVYIFGDSLSDTGNFSLAYGADMPSPPYFKNRASNGHVAIEHMAHKLGLKTDPSHYFLGVEEGTNYSVIGASASDLGSDMPEANLQAQLNAFLMLHGYEIPTNALYVVFFGGNDIRHARNALLNPYSLNPLGDAMAIVMQAVDNIAGGVDSLIEYGAKNILVVNAPDVGVIPETALIAQMAGVPDLPLITHNLTVSFNQALMAQIQAVEYNRMQTIQKFDLFATFNFLMANAAEFGITNTTDACYFTTFEPLSSVVNPLCLDENQEPDPNSFFFIDYIHPTKNIHKAVGKAMAELVKDSNAFTELADHRELHHH